MNAWILDSLGADRLRDASVEASRRRIGETLRVHFDTRMGDDELRFVARTLELRVFALLDSTDDGALRSAAQEAFQVARALARPEDPLNATLAWVRLGCLAVLGDRSADIRRLLIESSPVELPVESADWGTRVVATVFDLWIRLFRKDGWKDLDAVQSCVSRLRQDQRMFEPAYLAQAEARLDARPAWELMSLYHLAKAAEILGVFITQGSVDGQFDVREKLEAQFDRAIATAERGQLMERESLARLLARTARELVDNCIWTVTRAVNSRVTKFVQALTVRERQRPIFEMLPPQRRTLREEGLLGSAYRSVVVSLPTSSGKTFIAQFRILQALNQFDSERGWVAYLAPTRALVNQIALRLRRDFGLIGTPVEKVSPALEVDGLEASMLTDADKMRQFRVLVSTPEKLDLMLRGGWEKKIGRPLTLVVVDEAHGLGSTSRGLKLELLLATINRECKNAQFLLLTPFVRNASEIAAWLSRDSHKNIELGVDWSPNDRVIAIAHPTPGEHRSDFRVQLITQHTSRPTLHVPETLQFDTVRPLGLTHSAVKNNLGKLAAATAQLLSPRGTVIVLVGQPRHSWGVAETLRVEANRITQPSGDLTQIKAFLAHEMGVDFPLVSLLDYGIGVHHAGLSDDTRTLVEWLAEQNQLKALVATTTIAQGVNFPVSAVVFANHQYPSSVGYQEMPAEDFWNIAGRAGRVDQGDLGVVALVGSSPEKLADLKSFVQKNVGELNSTLIEMVRRVISVADLTELHTLSWQPEWSAFLQYLAHTYRQIGNHEHFAAQIEEVLRGTLGFQALRKSHRDWADLLVQGVYRYAERIKGKPLALVDATGFSWESVSATLGRIQDARLRADIWTPELFTSRRQDLQRALGVLLDVPELRDPLREVTRGKSPDGDTLARILCDWVQGRTLTDMAKDYFSGASPADEGPVSDSITAMTRCCQSVFGRLTQTASWGLAALQSLTLGDRLEMLDADAQRTIRNLPARVYYGVNSDAAVALRLLSVPRTAAEPLAKAISINPNTPLHELRGQLRSTDVSVWTKALGERGAGVHRVWSILEGESAP